MTVRHNIRSMSRAIMRLCRQTLRRALCYYFDGTTESHSVGPCLTNEPMLLQDPAMVAVSQLTDI